MDIKIIEKPSFSVIEKVRVHTTKNGENTKTVPAFWDEVHADGTLKTLEGLASDFTYAYGICYDNPNGDTFEYSIAVLSDETPPAGYRKTVIPARTWAVFPCKGAVSHSIADCWKQIMAFFKTSNYRSIRELDMEVYPDGDTDSEEYYCEIWVAVTEK